MKLCEIPLLKNCRYLTVIFILFEIHQIRNSQKDERNGDNLIKTDFLETIVKKYENDKNISKVLTVDYAPALGKGQNFASNMWRLNVKAVTTSGHYRKKNFIMKSVPADQHTADIINEMDVFNTEIDVYTNIIPKMEELIDKYKIIDGKLWADVLGYKFGDYIIFEDLKEFGFSNISKDVGFNELHVTITVKALAQFHALSVALNRNGLLNKQSFNKTLQFTNFSGYLENLFRACFRSIVQIVRDGEWGVNWKQRSDMLENYYNTIGDKLKSLYAREDQLFSVLCHGDCWLNNVMFKHSDLIDYPTGFRFVDFQFAHFGSFAWDLIYFFYTSLNVDLRLSKQNKFLEIYREALLINFKLLNLPNNIIPSIEEMQCEMMKLLPFAVLVHSTSFPITSFNSNDGNLDLGEMIISDDFKKYFTYSYTRENMKATFDYFFEKNVFQ